MSTFSQIVDAIAMERSRPDQIQYLAASLNQAMREVHSRPQTGSNVIFDASRVEEEVTLTGAEPYTWQPQAIARLQRIEAVYSQALGQYLPRRSPRVTMNNSREPFGDLYWYQTGPAIAFSGVCAGDVLKLAYAEFPPALAYIPPASRAVIYNAMTGEYTTPHGGTPTEADMAKSTHWLLQRWPSVFEQGLRAAMFRALGDETRSRTAYSAFESARLQLWQTEPTTTIQE